MSRIPIKANSVDPATGNAVSGVSVTVKNSLTASNVTVYSAQTGGSTVANPFTTDASGRAFYWVDRGPIQLDYAGAGITAFSEWAGDLADATDIVTALPGSPSDGQTILFQNAGMATNGQVWQLRYRAGGGTYKWEFVGGTGLYTSANSSVSFSTVGSNTALTGDMALTVPLAGDYFIEWSATVTHTGNNQGIYIFPNGAGFTGSGTAEGTGYVGQPAVAAPNAAFSISGIGRLAGLTSGGTLNLGYFVGATGGGYTGTPRRMRLTPIRVG